MVSTVTVQPQPAKQSRSTPLSKHWLVFEFGFGFGFGLGLGLGSGLGLGLGLGLS